MAGNAAYQFLKIRYLRRAERYNEATDLMLKAPRQASALVDPDAWWVERRILSRELLDLGKPQLAYKLVSAHAAESPTMAAEAEFHAGWYALRALNQPKTAAPHFAKIAEISSRPISASRAFYWLGRSAEAGSGGDARDYYRRSAHFGTTFYGQLSAAKLSEKHLSLSIQDQRKRIARGLRAVPPCRQSSGWNRSAIAVAQRRSTISFRRNSTVSANWLCWRSWPSATRTTIWRCASAKMLHCEVLMLVLSHPLGAIPANANISGSGKALAYAIARQESEFNVGAVSKAGARGLLQLMPATAKSVATRNGMSFSAPRLTTDAGYNATLGAHFLGEQLDRFNGSYVLTFAGYNAGPRRASEWVEKYGDPRGKPIDQVVDWIERIPYSETRNYVQRVMENYEVYKARLTGSADIQTDLIYGRR